MGVSAGYQGTIANVCSVRKVGTGGMGPVIATKAVSGNVGRGNSLHFEGSVGSVGRGSVRVIKVMSPMSTLTAESAISAGGSVRVMKINTLSAKT